MISKLPIILSVALVSFSLPVRSQNDDVAKWIGKYQFLEDSFSAAPHTVIIEIEKSGENLIYTCSETYKLTNRVFSGFCKIKNNSLQLYFSKVEKGKLEFKVVNKSKPYYEIGKEENNEYLVTRLQPSVAEISEYFKKIE